MWELVVIMLSILLLSFLLWKEYKRLNRAWLTARIVATIITVISLACIALPLSINREQKRSDSAIILLTEGFNKDSVQKMINANADAKIFTTGKSAKSFNARYVTDVSFFGDSFYKKTLHVFGYGLDENDISLLENTPVVFHPGAIENRITSIGWQHKLSSGEQLQVQGNFNNISSLPVKIILNGFDTNLDSVMLPANQVSYFQLTAIPKNLDKAVYTISILSGKDTLEKEPIPVETKTTEPFKILVLAASPDFENRFLKNWLAENEYKLAVRTTISKNKYDKQYTNISSISLERITSSLLENFDVIIADASELSALPVSDIEMIKNYVENKGIGLIVKSDGTGSSSAFYSKPFTFIETRDSIQHIIKLSIGDTSNRTSSLKIEQPLFIRSITGTQTLVTDQQMHIVTSSKLFGLGKVILTTIPNTYTWQLAGNKNDYSSYWSWILQKAAKKDQLQEAWNFTPVLPQKNEEVYLKLQTIKENIPQIQAAENIIYPAQNYQLPYEWNGTYWPIKTGWQSLNNNKGLTCWWYVYNNKDWKGIKALEKINVTKKYTVSHVNKSSKDLMSNMKQKMIIPKIYFFIIFIIFSGFLWFEKKYRNG